MTLVAVASQTSPNFASDMTVVISLLVVDISPPDCWVGCSVTRLTDAVSPWPEYEKKYS